IPGTCSGTDEGGCAYLANAPSAGTHTFTLWTESLRDADGDGIENLLDVCALIPNGSWNARASDLLNDSDEDGLPNQCDPHPDEKSVQSPLTCETGTVGNDEDQDCMANRADNCPSVNQLENPGEPPAVNNNPVQTDIDRDQI